MPAHMRCLRIHLRRGRRPAVSAVPGLWKCRSSRVYSTVAGRQVLHFLKLPSPCRSVRNERSTSSTTPQHDSPLTTADQDEMHRELSIVHFSARREANSARVLGEMDDTLEAKLGDTCSVESAGPLYDLSVELLLF